MKLSHQNVRVEIMKTKAKVIRAGENTSFVAVETANGDIAVFELLGCEKISLGNRFIGYWNELDIQVIYNESRAQQLTVFVHDCGCELDVVQKQYFTLRIPPQAPPTDRSRPANPAGGGAAAATPELHSVAQTAEPQCCQQ